MKKETKQLVANRVARQNGYHRATEIQLIPGLKSPKVLSHVSCGFRKNTTGEYVSNAYRANFRWKNTYYQHAETVVALPAEQWEE